MRGWLPKDKKDQKLFLAMVRSGLLNGIPKNQENFNRMFVFQLKHAYENGWADALDDTEKHYQDK